MVYDRVVIIGAGMMGLRLAENLAKNGINVDVYDGKKNIEYGADKASGVLSISGVKRLNIDYDPTVYILLYEHKMKKIQFFEKKPVFSGFGHCSRQILKNKQHKVTSDSTVKGPIEKDGTV